MGEPQPRTIVSACGDIRSADFLREPAYRWRMESPWRDVSKLQIWHAFRFGPDGLLGQRVTIVPRRSEPFVVATNYFDPRARRIADMGAKPSLQVLPGSAT